MSGSSSSRRRLRRSNVVGLTAGRAAQRAPHMNHSADLVLWRAHFLWIVDNPLLGSAYSLLPTTAHPSSIEAASLSTLT